tara:strand:- start:1405 stop:3684 length:2280 start_codon:yes stop_codon:yes gene_type:complete
MAFGTSIKLGNIRENWLFKLSNNNSGFLYFAFSDVTYNSNFYHGVILNSPSIRESIDLMRSTAKTSGITISIPDFTYQGDLISKELFGGTNAYINRECTVHSKINEDTPTQIGSFRIVSITTDGQKLNIRMNSHRPWNMITIPDTRTTDKRKIVPIAYGNYTRNSASTLASPQDVTDLTSYAYRPVEFNKIHEGFALYTNANSASAEAELAIYNEQFNVFVPLLDAIDTTVNTDNADHAKANPLCRHIFTVTPNKLTQYQLDSGITASNTANMIDGNSSTFAQFTASTSSTLLAGYVFDINIPEDEESFKKVVDSDQNEIKVNNSDFNATADTFNIDSGFSTNDIFEGAVIKLKEEIMTITNVSSNTLTVTRGAFNTTAISHEDNEEIFTTRNLNILEFEYEWDETTDGGKAILAVGTPSENFVDNNITADVSKNTIKLPYSSNNGDKIYVFMIWDGFTASAVAGSFKIYNIKIVASREEKKPPKKLYIANDGPSDNITGSGSPVLNIHEAHLDLLNRFTGLDVATSPNVNIDGWTSLNSNRSDWDVRVWINKEFDLKEVLEQMQFEGCFIFRFKQGDSTKPQYIYIKNSYSSGDITTLSKNDIADVSLRHVDFNEIFTSMVVNFGRHPAIAEHRRQETHKVDATRTKYNIQTKENIRTFTLDFVKNPNDVEFDAGTLQTFISHYYNLFGDIKLEIDFTLVNPAFYDLEVGSILQFDNNNMYPETPFGYNSSSWSNINFMIITTSRSRGELKIKAKQIS